MSEENSLREQIKAIDSMIDYIEKVLPPEIEKIKNDADSAAIFFRQHGRTDLADEHLVPKMAKIREQMDELMAELNKENLDYLYRERERLNRALNRY